MGEYLEASALHHYCTYLLERQPHLAHFVDHCVVDTYHVACLTRTPRRVTVRPATPTARSPTPEYTPLSPVVPALVDSPETPPDPYTEDDDGWTATVSDGAFTWAELEPIAATDDYETEDEDPEEVEDEDIPSGWAIPVLFRLDL